MVRCQRIRSAAGRKLNWSWKGQRRLTTNRCSDPPEALWPFQPASNFQLRLHCGLGNVLPGITIPLPPFLPRGRRPEFPPRIARPGAGTSDVPRFPNVEQVVRQATRRPPSRTIHPGPTPPPHETDGGVRRASGIAWSVREAAAEVRIRCGPGRPAPGPASASRVSGGGFRSRRISPRADPGHRQVSQASRFICIARLRHTEITRVARAAMCCISGRPCRRRARPPACAQSENTGRGNDQRPHAVGLERSARRQPASIGRTHDVLLSVISVLNQTPAPPRNCPRGGEIALPLAPCQVVDQHVEFLRVSEAVSRRGLWRIRSRRVSMGEGRSCRVERRISRDNFQGGRVSGRQSGLPGARGTGWRGPAGSRRGRGAGPGPAGPCGRRRRGRRGGKR